MSAFLLTDFAIRNRLFQESFIYFFLIEEISDLHILLSTHKVRIRAQRINEIYLNVPVKRGA